MLVIENMPSLVIKSKVKQIHSYVHARKRIRMAHVPE